MLELINNFFISIQHDIAFWAYFLVFVIAIMETTLGLGLFVPGSSFILVAGAFSAKGYFKIYPLIILAILGAIIGDNINYFLGKRYGREWTKNGIWFLKKKHFVKAEKFFQKHGGKSVFLGRFIPTIKEIVPFVAGTLKMKKNTFFFWNVLGAIGWGLEWSLAGYFFGQSLEITKLWLVRISIVLGVIFTIHLIYLFYKLFLKEIIKKHKF